MNQSDTPSSFIHNDSQSFKQMLSQFKNRCVRDLAWVIASPPLVSGNIDDVLWWSYQNCLDEFNDCLSELIKLDEHPQSLLIHLSNLKNMRLGSIFEGLVSYWLRISPNYRELYQNIQIIEDNHTYGEIDFIIEEIFTTKVIHLEVAVKFYLGCAPYEDAYRWFGTNTKDQLGKKIDHLKLHQTQLSSNHPDKLKKYCPESINEKQCFVKGRLFYPDDSDTAPQNLPFSTLEKNHLRGRWAYVSQLQKAQYSHHYDSNRLIKINKSHWLADLNTMDINDLGAIDMTEIEAIDRAECFVEFEESNSILIEKQRVFYLPNTFTFPTY